MYHPLATNLSEGIWSDLLKQPIVMSPQQTQ